MSIPSVPGGYDAVARATAVSLQSILSGLSLGGAHPSSTANLTQAATKIKAGAATFVFVGHSIPEGLNQNWREASIAKIFQRRLEQAFPDCVFTFINLSLGGRIAANFANTGYVGAANDSTPATSYFRAAQSTLFISDVWHSPDLSINGSAVGKSWRQQVIDAAPDLVLFLMDLNENTASGGLYGFITAMETILTNFQTGVDWTTKPSVILGTSHTGNQNRPLMLSIHRAIRGLAEKYKVPLFDAGRIYEILTTGLDPVNHAVSGEAAFRYSGSLGASAAFTLDPVYWSQEGGFNSASSTMISTGGTTVRNSTINADFRAYRKRIAYDGRVRASFSSFSNTPQFEILMRRDPAVAANTSAEQYIIRLSGTTISLIVRVNNATTTITTATFSPAISNGSLHFVEAEAIGGRIRASVNGKRLIDVIDNQVQAAGWWGVGQPVNGQTVQLTVGSTLESAFSIEYLDPAPVFATPPMTASQLLGTVNDFATNPDSVGGNTINHLTTNGYTLIYPQAFIPVIRTLQAAVSR